MRVDASYPGVCAGCGQHYPEGTPLRHHGDGWGHAECPPEPPPPQVCPSCFLQLPVTGVCPDCT